jgi:hypothetical protein
MRLLTLIVCLLLSANAAALEPPRTQCNETSGFSVDFGDRVTARDVRRALRAYPDFSSVLINDGDSTRPAYRITAIARYETEDQAEAVMHLMLASLLESEQFAAVFADGDIDDETLSNGIIFYSGDVESNQGVAMQIATEYASVAVSCTDLRARSEALTATP